MTQYVLVMCSECEESPIAAAPLGGNAKAWEGMFICEACSEKHGVELRQQWEAIKTGASTWPGIERIKFKKRTLGVRIRQWFRRVRL